MSKNLLEESVYFIEKLRLFLFVFRHLRLLRQDISDYSFDGLTELHLGQAKVSSDEISDILRKKPQLRLLKHYQLTTALCHLHGKDWRTSPGILPTYKLKNIDADFSHVVRCRMSPHAVLPPDALKLAVALCPEATSIRLRFDCSTPHHVVGPLVNLKALRELSAVCVTSGERTLLDFTDMIPILEQHGPKTLNMLELKVLEEVDPHVIGHVCTQLESLTLSGCGYVTPPTCQQFRCRKKSARLQQLKYLFYADGDDFSWDHSLPQCFWRSTMSSDKRFKSSLECVCLESPRMTVDTLKESFDDPASFPRLKILTVCRAPEIDFETIESLSRVAPNLSYLRLTSCEKINARFGARIKKLYPDIELKID
ncbi:uncharacterized protein LOC106667882 [Cimex lectularius]|uniref:Uncharacterized protein n=1 Tax=Cimex lectularius TaxID=79782 RepID=A0A8I6TL10_CIMLE|nr:uncharacterized protein LOC106667882 [Cimex lectularius]